MNVFLSQALYERLDWFEYGVSSINRTGAFIACLVMACWVILVVKREWSFWLAVLFSAILLYFLAQTQSRGALVALSVAFPAFFCLSRIKLNKKQIIVLGCLLVFFVLYSLHVGFADRVSSMVAMESSSVNCRADIYLSGIKMMTDALGGFQHIESPAFIYYHWYQAPISEKYLSMLNSHLEFMCMHGIALKIVYIFFWVFVFAVTFPRKGRVLSSVAFCTWVCFFISASFSNVANYWPLWVAPILLLIFSSVENKGRLKNINFWGITAILTMSIAVVLWLCSICLPREERLSFKDECVYIGSPSESPILVLQPDRDTLGNKPGKYLISHAKKHSRYIIQSNDIDERQYDAVVISGQYDEDEMDTLNAGRIIFFNSDFPVEQNKEWMSNKNILVVLGEFSDWKNREGWEEVVNAHDNIKLKIVDGAADYIPDWTDYLEDQNGEKMNP